MKCRQKLYWPIIPFQCECETAPLTAAAIFDSVLCALSPQPSQTMNAGVVEVVVTVTV